MLPGLRFLFGAIILSMSILVFGLGAAALLRAAHEEFASMPSRRPPPETIFAQPNNDAARPVLSMLRVDPPAEEPKAPDNRTPENQAPESIQAAAPPAEPEAIAATPAEPEQVAALKPDDSSPPASEKTEIAVTETPAPTEAAPAVAAADAPAPTEEIKIAAAPEVPSPANEAAPAASGQAGAPASPQTDLASIKIATLGGPPVTIEKSAHTTAKAEGSVIKKRAQARRAKERRRLAQRARLARQAAPQQPADLFPQPTITTRAR